MPNHKLGGTYQFSHLASAFHADPQGDNDVHYLLHRGDDILALCLKHKFNPKDGEVWIGDEAIAAQWGERLAALKGHQTLPLYRSERGRTLFTYKGEYLIAGDTVDPSEIAKRKGPVSLSRIVFIQPVEPRKSLRST